MDRGTNAIKMITGEDVPLRLGYVAVKNRSQNDIINHLTIADAIKNEKEYFTTHPLYRSLSPSHFGMDSLTEKLTKVLFKHIRNFLPEIKNEIK